MTDNNKIPKDLDSILSTKNYYAKVDSFQQHIEEYIGQILYTLCDHTDDYIITYFVVEDTKNKSFTIVTCSESIKTAELVDLDFCISLPSSSNFLKDSSWFESKNDENLYPIRLLAEIVDFNLHKKALGIGHTITPSRNDDKTPFPRFKSFMIHLPILFPSEFGMIEQYKSLIFSVYPLLQGEYEFKKQNDSDALMDLLYSSNNLVFDPERSSAVTS